MPRIRTIKPEFWSSPGIENTSPWSRLLFIAMWNWADDAGRGTCQLRELQAFAFPYDEDAPEVATMAGFRRTLAEVRDQYDVVFYKVSGRPYYAIPSWKRHQRNERTAKSKYPAPNEGEKWDFLGPDQRSSGSSDILRPTVAEADFSRTEESPDPREAPEDEEVHEMGASGVIPLFGTLETPSELGSGGTSDILRHGAAEVPQSSGTGTGEQGNRGTGDLYSASAPSSPDGEGPTDPPPAFAGYDDTRFQMFWDHYPHKVSKKKAVTAFEKALKRTSFDALMAGLRRYLTEDRRALDGFVKDPTTWLNGDCWDDEPVRRANQTNVVGGARQEVPDAEYWSSLSEEELRNIL